MPSIRKMNVLIGILLAVFGTVIIHVYGVFSNIGIGSSSLLGNFLIFGAVLSEALFIIFGKFVAQRASPLAHSTIVSFFGVILFLPFSLYEGSQFEFEEVSITEWGFVLYFDLVETVLAFMLIHQGVSKVSASQANTAEQYFL